MPLVQRRSRFIFADANDNPLDWTTTLPVRPWLPEDSTVGGRRIAASGFPASFIVRRDDLLGLTVRFLETEWEFMRDLVAFGQRSGQTILWYPEAAVTDDQRIAWLDAPGPGERWGPSRSAEYPRAMEVPLVLRDASQDNSSLWRPYFSEE